MNHYMLPEGDNVAMKNKYASEAIPNLVNTMKKLDPHIDNLTAQIFGGGAVVGHLSTGISIGTKNIAMADKMLAKYGIKVTRREVGGNNGVKIFFDSTTGNVDLRIIERSALTAQLEDKKKSLAGRKIRVLIVDDSPTIRQILRNAFDTDPVIEVIGEAQDPYEAREKILELDPDVVTLDIIMPKMDGITFLKKLMLHLPKPVIVVSSVAQKGGKQRMRAKDIGAIDVLDKEELSLYGGIEKAASIIIPKVKFAATQVVGKKSKEDIANI